jgi:hypothetical protein
VGERFLAKVLSFGFLNVTVGRSCLGGGEVVLQCKGSNLIFLVGMDVGETIFLFWVGVIRLERDGLVCVMGLSKLGGLVGPFSMSSNLHVLGPLKLFDPIKGSAGLFKNAYVTLKRTKASVRLELGSVLGMG